VKLKYRSCICISEQDRNCYCTKQDKMEMCANRK